MMTFLSGAIEQTSALWASSYLVTFDGVTIGDAAGYAGLYFIGVTVGRFLSGVFSSAVSDLKMIKIGIIVAGAEIMIITAPLGYESVLAGLVTVGIGCAPVYPNLIHSVPSLFGEERSQAVIGIQIAAGYLGMFSMPPLFGFIADIAGAGAYPYYILVLWIIMILSFRMLNLTDCKKDQP